MRSDIEFLLLFAGFFSLAGVMAGLAITSARVRGAYDAGRRQGVAEAAIYMAPAVEKKSLQRVK